ncbi:MAG TPA: alpha/beta fold hydrolase [Burkholderiaceae bacterium]
MTPTQSFFSHARFVDAKLSPDGKAVGMLATGREGRLVLAVMDLASKQVDVVGSAKNADIGDFHWVNSQRLVFSTTDRRTAAGEVRYYPGLFAVNRDGGEARMLVERSPWQADTTGTSIKNLVLPGNTFFKAVDRSGKSDDIFVEQTVFDVARDLRAIRLLTLNTKTGRASAYDRPGDTVEWVIDAAGVPRINETLHDGISEIFYRDPATDKWRKLASFEAYTGAGGFAPYGFGPDGKLYVEAHNGRDTNAIYRYDFEKNAIEPEPLIAADGYDFHGSLVFDNVRKILVGVHYETDAEGTVWFDPEMKKIQDAVDALLPRTVNTLSFGASSKRETVLVRSYSDLQPVMFYLFDTASGSLSLIGNSHPDIDPKKMSAMTMVHYKGRDGLDIPAYLTTPRGVPKKNLPLVVLVHGGPYVHADGWRWDPEVQFLASRGYAVLQPEYRGTTGYGTRHFKAGWKQWGLAMQDDIDDGARWAIAQGIADPKRIAVAGASYGGYATLMGLAKDPELFRCGVEWVGVTDINLMYQSDWSNDMSAEWQHFGMPVLIGDQIKDAEQLKATSPVNLANRIKQPLLMAYGGSDRRVPLAHGKNFLSAVRATNDKVEWVEYLEEGHGWILEKNRFDFWARVEKFLDANMGSSH